MANEVNVVAYVRGENGQDCSRTRAEIKAAAQAAGASYYDFGDAMILLDKVQKDLLKPKPYPCFRSLEIFSHGAPEYCDDLNLGNIKAFAQKLMRLRLCDNFDVYLSGCNTGLKRESGKKPSIAEELANAMPFKRGKFDVHVTVHGSAGYKQGSHAGGDITVREASFSQPRNVNNPQYKGARTDSGAAAYNDFPNPGR